MKNSITLNADLIYLTDYLTDEQLGKLFKHILEYAFGNPEPLDDHLLEIAFSPIKVDLDYQLRNSGKNHWNWKGGISPENKVIRNSTRTKEWRQSVFERDQYTCCDCGQRGGELNAHHIKSFSKFPELRFDIGNGKTLCKKCHIKIHKKIKECQTVF